jgi:DNA/RNA endonuclease YhcR with UshA esterase domain
MRIRSFLYLSIAAVTISATLSSAALAQKVVTAQEASQHVGQVVTVTGIIGGVGHSPRSNTTFINFGAPFPNHDFTAVIFASAAPRFPDVDSWNGKTVSVTGVVKMYRGKPEIVLNSLSQIKVSK